MIKMRATAKKYSFLRENMAISYCLIKGLFHGIRVQVIRGGACGHIGFAPAGQRCLRTEQEDECLVSSPFYSDFNASSSCNAVKKEGTKSLVR